MEEKIFESIAYILPASVTGLTVYFIFRNMLKQQFNILKIHVLSEKKKEGLPIKLKANERMLLFCERIHPSKLVIRIAPISENPKDYANLIVSTIEQEFEHNLVQQLYVSKETWMAVIASKKAIIHKLKQTAEGSSSASNFRENILNDYSKVLPPTETTIAIIKNEVKKLL